ncbi:MAG: hypothetical protein BWY76_00781 [bacterium ADurb.Bin429]|nr:MAG: hypothetical protein BWY76_00781 [bacterium ADurb.Bin429]
MTYGPPNYEQKGTTDRRQEARIILDLLALYRREGASPAMLEKLRELRRCRDALVRRPREH